MVSLAFRIYTYVKYFACVATMRLRRWISSQVIQLRSLVQIRPPQLQFISFQLFPSTPQPRPRDSSGRNGSKSESKEKQNYGMAEETKKRLAPLRDRQAF